ncbi:glycosyltransferase [Chitinophaga nivalis]|uniref:Glycosyltransferase n=1 Tax=Chitinophaga nivalis TaxID=2991709 RepID=A0ABT3IRF8_9BACT|nr:glycosyltransferase [Chitinophaga nivalis]MCW3463970.1 glycosyltransferase [Chitinophaga nivalis]MCW3486340.1 glycosyltransferase [Chitinophaga nivalis]
MNKAGSKPTIGIITNGFISWGGGVDFIKMVIRGLAATGKFNLAILVPDHSTLPERKENRKQNKRNKLLYRLGLRRDYIDTNAGVNEFREFRATMPVLDYHVYDGGLESVIEKNGIQLLIPSIQPLKPTVTIPWIGYLYDFQHKYLAHFFSEEERANRDIHFRDMLATAKTVIVNSHAVKNDANTFFPQDHARIVNLPFTPMFHQGLLAGNFAELKQKYNLPEKYFIISNQFWQHKSHITAFRALKEVLDSIPEKVSIVCTGATSDNRHAAYFEELQAEIHAMGITQQVQFLGYISKEDQVQILQHAIALIQPTLFEGGPGGGATYDAIAIGQQAIISDIPINQEITDPLVTFFKVSDHHDLAAKMKAVIAAAPATRQQPDVVQLQKESDQRLQLLGEVLARIVEEELA